MSRKFMMAGALAGAISVALGAFGAHSLENLLTADRMEVYQTGARYLMIHALILFVTGRMLRGRSTRILILAGVFFFSGMLLFSGSLVALSLTNLRILGAVAPVGGASYISGWLLLAWYAFKDHT